MDEVTGSTIRSDPTAAFDTWRRPFRSARNSRSEKKPLTGMLTVGNEPSGARPAGDTLMRSIVLLMEFATQSEVPVQASEMGPDSTATGAPTGVTTAVAPCTAPPLKQAA